MPTLLPIATQAALEKSVSRYVSTLGQDFTQQALDRLLSGVKSILNPTQEARANLPEGQTATVGDTPATVRGGIADLLKRFDDPDKIAEELNLDFKIQVATEVSNGAGRYVADNADQAEVDEYPALELLRVYDRIIPRGDETDKSVRADNDWPSRWEFAAAESGDTDAASILQRTGRMIALKASPIWQSLGDGAGGYDDTLGNPFPPFAFNSGMDTDAVSRAECIDLGFLQPGQNVQPAAIDFNSLFGLEAAA